MSTYAPYVIIYGLHTNLHYNACTIIYGESMLQTPAVTHPPSPREGDDGIAG